MLAVAIDGPGGAGKSTIAKACAASLGFIYVDTGALYRAIGYFVVSHGDDTSLAEQVLPHLENITLDIRFIDGAQHVFVNGDDVSSFIRTPEISMAASNVSKIPKVRAFLLETQRDFAKKNNVIMDGRDIGTVVLPDAKLKIFLTASDEARARRRYDELIAKGENVSYDDVLTDLRARDYQDSHREIAPLKPADDSVIVDTSELTLDESIEKIKNLIINAQNDDDSSSPGSFTDESGLTFSVKTGKNILAEIIKVIMTPFWRAIMWYRVIGKENLPKDGGFIFCSNHVCAIDPVLWAYTIHRRVHFMSKQELFTVPFFRRIIRYFDAFPVKRGSHDMSSINFAGELVKSGEILAIFPEGTRSKDGKPGRAKSGAAYIANATGGDVVPAAIVCRGKIRPFKPFKLVIGKPIPHDEIAFDELAKDNLRRVSNKIMGEITSLWEDNLN